MALENQDWKTALFVLLLAAGSRASQQANQTTSTQPPAAGSAEKSEGDSVAQSTDLRAVFGYPLGETTHGVGYGHHLHPFYYQGSGDSLRYSCALQGEWRPIVQNHDTHHHHYHQHQQQQQSQYDAFGGNQLQDHHVLQQASTVALSSPATTGGLLNHLAIPEKLNEVLQLPLVAPPLQNYPLADYWNSYKPSFWAQLGIKNNHYKSKYKLRPGYGSKGHGIPLSYQKSKFNLHNINLHHNHKYPSVFDYGNLPHKDQANLVNEDQQKFHVNVIPIGAQWQQDFLSIQPEALHGGISTHFAGQSADLKAIAGGAISQTSDLHGNAAHSHGPLSCTASGHYQVQDDPLLAAPSAHYQVQSTAGSDASSGRYNVEQSSTALNALLGSTSGHLRLQPSAGIGSLVGNPQQIQYNVHHPATLLPFIKDAAARYKVQHAVPYDPLLTSASASVNYHAQKNNVPLDAITGALSGHYSAQITDPFSTAISGHNQGQDSVPAQVDASTETPGMTVAIFPMQMMLNAKPDQSPLSPPPPLQAGTHTEESLDSQVVVKLPKRQKQRNLRLTSQVIRMPFVRRQNLHKRTMLRPPMDAFGSLFWPK